MKKKLFICEHCNKEIKKVIKTDDRYSLCDKCFENKTIACDCCGDVVYNYKETDDGYELCNDCYNSEITTCDCCGDVYYDVNNFYTTASGEKICEGCYDREYFTCQCCDEVYRIDDSHETTDGLVCDYCRNRYYLRCDHCREVFHTDDTYHTDNDYILCSSCWDQNVYEDEDGDFVYSSLDSIIKDYSYKPTPKFQGEGNLYFGIELEIGKILDGFSREELAKTLLNEIGDVIYIKDDGSLNNGFEIVTHPMTFEFIKNIKLFEKIEEVLYKKARAYNKGGMHIHISRNAFEDDFHLINFMTFINYFTGFSNFIAQRKSKRWAKMWSVNLIKDINLNLTYNLSYDRYMSVNLENYNTIEVRIFNANILANRNYKNIEFLHALFEFSKGENFKLNVNEFLKFIKNNESKYQNLLSFIDERIETFNKVKEVKALLPSKVYKEFLKFLKENGTFHKFFYNLPCKARLYSLILKKEYDFLPILFCWIETTEGYDFWEETNHKWNNLLERLQNGNY